MGPDSKGAEDQGSRHEGAKGPRGQRDLFSFRILFSRKPFFPVSSQLSQTYESV